MEEGKGDSERRRERGGERQRASWADRQPRYSSRLFLLARIARSLARTKSTLATRIETAASVPRLREREKGRKGATYRTIYVRADKDKRGSRKERKEGRNACAASQPARKIRQSQRA